MLLVPNSRAQIAAFTWASLLSRFTLLVELFVTLHSIGMRRPSNSRTGTSAFRLPTNVSAQKVPSGGAFIMLGIGRAGISAKPIPTRKVLSAASCAFFSLIGPVGLNALSGEHCRRRKDGSHPLGVGRLTSLGKPREAIGIEGLKYDVDHALRSVRIAPQHARRKRGVGQHGEVVSRNRRAGHVSQFVAKLGAKNAGNSAGDSFPQIDRAMLVQQHREIGLVSIKCRSPLGCRLFKTFLSEYLSGGCRFSGKSRVIPTGRCLHRESAPRVGLEYAQVLSVQIS